MNSSPASQSTPGNLQSPPRQCWLRPNLWRARKDTMKTVKVLWASAALLSIAIPATAHHGTGTSYDLSKPITLEGTVTEFHYANPHPQLFFDVAEAKGGVTHWSAEFYPNPAQLQQGGWGKRRSEAALAPGTKITITLAPSRAGTQVGAILKLLN